METTLSVDKTFRKGFRFSYNMCNAAHNSLKFDDISDHNRKVLIFIEFVLTLTPIFREMRE